MRRGTIAVRSAWPYVVHDDGNLSRVSADAVEKRGFTLFEGRRVMFDLSKKGEATNLQELNEVRPTKMDKGSSGFLNHVNPVFR